MKRVVLIRHAKTVSYGYDQDFDRTLTERGEEDAHTISKALKNNNVYPDLIISSPAIRTRQTTGIFARTLGYDLAKVLFEKKLYSGKTPEGFLELLQEQEDDKTTIFVVGHNPMIYYYLNYLIDSFTDDVPTCSTVVIQYDTNKWEDLRPQSGKMIYRYVPDMFH